VDAKNGNLRLRKEDTAATQLIAFYPFAAARKFARDRDLRSFSHQAKMGKRSE
jgi:hypothetical protein